jgi:NTP pyrophosphatase (non-canonical NTP hydrolase)
MDIKDYCELCHDRALEKGFYDEPKRVGEQLMLVVSELGEAQEAHRKGRVTSSNANIDINIIKSWEGEAFQNIFHKNVKDTLEDEIADTVIRLFDMCGALGIDLQTHIEMKLKYNLARPKMHGKLY